jgi:hypothetical protein
MDLRKILVASILVLLPALGGAQTPPHTHEHSFRDAEKWSHVFDDPKRDAWQKPHAVIQALALERIIRTGIKPMI